MKVLQIGMQNSNYNMRTAENYSAQGKQRKINSSDYGTNSINNQSVSFGARGSNNLILYIITALVLVVGSALKHCHEAGEKVVKNATKTTSELVSDVEETAAKYVREIPNYKVKPDGKIQIHKEYCKREFDMYKTGGRTYIGTFHNEEEYPTIVPNIGVIEIDGEPYTLRYGVRSGKFLNKEAKEGKDTTYIIGVGDELESLDSRNKALENAAQVEVGYMQDLTPLVQKKLGFEKSFNCAIANYENFDEDMRFGNDQIVFYSLFDRAANAIKNANSIKVFDFSGNEYKYLGKNKKGFPVFSSKDFANTKKK